MATETILVIETSLDDCQPQVVGYVLERALDMGALDAYTVPAQMKKNRPGLVLTILARPDQREAMVQLLLRETSTLGVRIHACEREILVRKSITVNTEFGKIAVKVTGEKAAPEYEDCRRAAKRHGATLRTVMAAATAAYDRKKLCL